MCVYLMSQNNQASIIFLFKKEFLRMVSVVLHAYNKSLYLF